MITLYKEEAKSINPGQIFIAQHVPFSTTRVDLIPISIPGIKIISTCREHKRQFCPEEFCQYPENQIISVENIFQSLANVKPITK